MLIIGSFAFMTSTGWAQAKEGRLNIDVQDGQVSVFAAGVGLSDAEVAAIRAQIEERVQRSPLRQHGTVHVTLQGQLLDELTQRLHGLDLSDKRATRAVVDDLMKSRFEHQDRPLTDPVEVVIGRGFAFGPANMPGSIVAIGASGRIDGPISDVIALGSHIELAAGAEVSERLVSVGSQLDLAQGARITGQEVNVSLPDFSAWTRDSASWSAPERSVWSQLATGLFGVALSLGLGVLFARIAPQISQQSLERVQREPWAALGIGFVHYFAIVPVLVLLVITLIGIPLVPLYLMGLGLLFWLAYVLGALYVGQMLVRSHPQWQQLLIGLVVLLALSFIPVLGGLLAFGLVTLGVGAIVLSVYARLRNRSQRPPSARAAQPEAPRELPTTGEAPSPQHS